MTQLVLLGGGHAHLQVLRALAREPLPRARVTLVSPFPQLVYSGMVPGLVAGHYEASACMIPLAPWAGRAGATFVQAAAAGIDAAARRLRLDDGHELAYDVLSADTGAVMDRDAIAGAREHALFLRPIEHFMQRWPALRARAAATPLEVAVVGGGAAGVEIALALRHRLGGRSRVHLVAGVAPVLAAYPPVARWLARRALRRQGIAIVEQACVEVSAGGIRLGDARAMPCDVALLAIGGSAPGWLGASGLALDAHGFIATGATLQSLSHAEVFAVGDVASRVDAPRPRSGVYAVRAGPPLADNLRRFVEGSALRRYRPQARSLNLLACGEQRAIASWGSFAAEGRWAWRWKDRVDRGFVDRFAKAGP